MNLFSAALLFLASFPHTSAEEVACSQHSDCHGIGSECARVEALESAPLVCCSHGDPRVAHMIKLNDELGEVCLNRKVGAACGGVDKVCASGVCGLVNDICEEEKREADYACYGDAICKSNVCVKGVCMAEKQEDGKTCDNDTDCTSGRCSKKSSSVKMTRSFSFSQSIGTCGPAALFEDAPSAETAASMNPNSENTTPQGPETSMVVAETPANILSIGILDTDNGASTQSVAALMILPLSALAHQLI